MDLSRSLLKDFAKVVNDTTDDKNRSKYVRGTVKTSGGTKYVQIDGSSSLTPISEVVDVQDGDRVLVSIENHKATILGNFTFPPSARKEQEAIDKAEGAQSTADSANTNSNLAMEKAQDAQENADKAISDSEEASRLANEAKDNASQAIIAADSANTNAQEAKEAATGAASDAATARQEAAAAQSAVANVNAEVVKINGEITTVKGDISTALGDLADQAAEIEATKETLELNYAKKTDVSTVEANLKTEISKKVGELQTTVEQNYAGKTDVVDLEGRLQTQITQNQESISSSASKIEKLESDTTEAQKQVNTALEKAEAAQTAATDAQSKATAAQTAADEAKANATTAAGKADAAQTAADAAQAKADAADKAVQTAQGDLDEAKQNLINVTNRVGATEEEIAEAQTKVDAAQQAVNNALADAAEANLAATNAKAAADKAAEDAAQAQTDASNAQIKADNAQAVADKAQSDALKAQEDVAALTKRVTTAETNISQNAEQIALTAQKTDEIGDSLVNNYYNKVQADAAIKLAADQISAEVTEVNEKLVNDYYTKEQADAAIKLSSDSITSTVSKTYTTKSDAVKNTVEQFYQSNSPTVLSGGSWSATQPTWTEGKYIWRRTLVTKADGSTSYTPSANGVCITGNTGPKGDNGEDGIDGKGVKNTEIFYYLSTSNTTQIGGAWSTDIPEWVDGKYYWQKFKYTYTDDTMIESKPVCVTGGKGSDGEDGADGKSISSFATEFYLSTSKESPTGGEWVDEMPTWSKGMYLWTRSKIVYKNPTSTEYTEPICDSSWEAVNDIQVGGRNILLNSSFHENIDQWSSLNKLDMSFLEYKGKQCTKVDGVIGNYDYLRQSILGKLEPDTQYTASAWVLAENIVEGDTNFCLWWAYHSGKYGDANKFFSYGHVDIPVNTGEGEWQRVTWTFTTDNEGKVTSATESWMYVYFRDYTGQVYFSEVQLEKGSLATDWTPAPEDIQDGIDNAQSTADEANSTASAVDGRVTITESEIQQLAESISMLVTDGDGNSMMTQTSDGWRFDISSITDNLDAAKDQLNDLSGAVSDADQTIQNVKDLANDLAEKTAYIVMTTDDSGDPCIELGKSDNDFKLRITNESIDFMDGSSRIAYVSNQMLYITKAVIKDELQIGEGSGYVWKKRSNGNMGLRYVGG